MVGNKSTLPFRCVIIDDEPPAIVVVTNYIKRMNELHLVAAFGNAMEAKKYIEENHPEIIISDIKMPGKSGIDFVKGLAYQPSVIFASAYDQYAINGFELGVIDFLRKPFSFQRFSNAIHKIIKPKITLLPEAPFMVKSSSNESSSLAPSLKPVIQFIISLEVSDINVTDPAHSERCF